MKQLLKDHDMRSYVARHSALVGFIACLLIIFGTVAYVAKTSAETRHALCALRGDLEQRIDSSTAFLQKHPEGIPGVEPKLIPRRHSESTANGERAAQPVLRLTR